MIKTSSKIVFFGSGPVAAESLKLLLKHQTVEAVITKPTTRHEMESIAEDIPVYTVSSKSDLNDLFERENFSNQLGILIDFGIIVSQKIIDYFKRGIINSHFSLLPQWRGADPITFSILSGQKQTGVSLMLLVQAMDEGPILAQRVYDIKDDENSSTLTHELVMLSDALLGDIVPAYLSDTVNQKTGTKTIPRSQDEVNRMWQNPLETSYSRKLTKEDGILDFTKPAAALEREVRGFIQWPKSRTEIAGKDVVITKAHAVPSIGADDQPGDIITVPEAKMLGIATSAGTLWIDELKPAGKKSMPIAAFLAGYGSKL